MAGTRMSNINAGQIKLTLIGDSLTGKTCMVDVYITRKYNPSLLSTPCEYYSQPITVDGKEHSAVLMDTSGMAEYDNLRSHFHRNTSCFIMVYSIANRKSFENITNRWFPIINKSAEKVPFLLVGTKSDYRAANNNNQNETRKDLVKTKEGIRLAKKLHARAFLECSSKEQINLDQVFMEAIRTLDKKKPDNSWEVCRGCVIS